MRQTFLHTKDEMLWLKNTHLYGIQLKYIPRSAMLFGSEFAPVYIELYRSHFPHVTEKPYQIIQMEGGHDIACH